MTEFPFLGEGEKNFNLWMELQRSRVHCILSRATNTQALNTGVVTTTLWDNEISDPGGMHVAGSSDIVIPQPGIYSVHGQGVITVTVAPGGVFTYSGTVYKVGGPVNEGYGWQILGAAGVTFTYVQTCGGPMKCKAGDVIRMDTFQNTLTNYNTAGSVGGPFEPRLAVVMVNPL